MREAYTLDQYIKEVENIRRARQFAQECHKGQLRKGSKTPYFEHPCRVANDVWRHADSDANAVMAAYLHDVVEDCGVTLTTITMEFGDEVGKLVKWLTNTTHGLK